MYVTRYMLHSVTWYVLWPTVTLCYILSHTATQRADLETTQLEMNTMDERLKLHGQARPDRGYADASNAAKPFGLH